MGEHWLPLDGREPIVGKSKGLGGVSPTPAVIPLVKFISLNSIIDLKTDGDS